MEAGGAVVQVSNIEVEVCVLCHDDVLAEELEDALDQFDLGIDFLAPSLASIKSHLSGAGHPPRVVAFLSLRDLVSGGLDALLEADAFFRDWPSITPVLMVEPEVQGERETVGLVTGLTRMVDAGRIAEQLRAQLGDVLPGRFSQAAMEARAQPSRPPEPPPAAPEPPPAARAPERQPPIQFATPVRGGAGDGKLARSGQQVMSGDEPGRVQLELLEAQSGDLGEVWLARVLYSLHARAFTGRLKLETQDHALEVLFHDGQAGGLQGDRPNKLLAAFAWTGGRYEAIPGPPPPHFMPFEPMLALIYEGSLRFTSINRAAERLTAYSGRYPVTSEFLAERDEELRAHATLMRFCRSCNGQRIWDKVISMTWDDIREVFKAACYAIDTDLVVLCDAPQASAARVEYSTRSIFGLRRSLSQLVARKDTRSGIDIQETLDRLQRRLNHFSSIDAYELFGLNPGCGKPVVRDRYYKLVKDHHPDIIGGNISPEVKALAELIFIHIKDAYVELLALEKGATGPTRGPSERHSSPLRHGAPSGAHKAAMAQLQQMGASSGGPASRAAGPNPAVSRPAPVVSRPVSVSPPSPRPAEPRPSAPSQAASGSGAGHSPVSGDGIPPVRPRQAAPVEIRPARQVSPSSARRTTGEFQRPTTGVEPAPRPATPPPVARQVSSARAPMPNAAPAAPGVRVPAKGAEAPGDAGTSDEGEAPRRSPTLTSQQLQQLSKHIPPQKHFKAGERFLRSGQFGKAREAFKLASDGEPANPMYKAHVAWCQYMMTGDNRVERAKVIEMLTQCLQMKDGRKVEVNVFLGRIFKKEGDTERAMRYFQAAVELDKACVEALREVRLYNMRKEDPGPEADSGKSLESLLGKFFQRNKK